MLRSLLSILVLGLGVTTFAAPLSAQQQTTVTGRVTDQANGRPVPAANVVVQGTTRGTVTREDGSFSLAVTPGNVQLRVARIGYQPELRTVVVAAGEATTADFQLTATATTLEQVVVTATGEEQRSREQGTAITQITVQPERLATVQNLSQTLAAQAPGLQVLQSGGTAGTGARIRIRGANSMSLSNEPLIIVDGVRVTSGASSNTVDVGGQAPSRLNDINPDDIESIEVLRGPAAAGLYGTQAANGVIQITTRRGRSGDPRWGAYVDGGTTEGTTEFPDNFGAWRTTAAGAAAFGCNLYSVTLGSCTQDSVVSFNPLREVSPFRTGTRMQYGLNVSGGTEQSTYYLSGEWEDEAGIYRTSELNRLNFRANLASRLRDDLDVNVSTGYVSSDLRLPENDNNFLGYVSNGLAGFARVTSGDSGYDPIGPSQIDQIRNAQEVRRILSSVNADWRPLTFLRVNATAGLDLLNRFDSKLFPVGAVQLGAEYDEGQRTSNRLQFSTYTANISTTATFALTPDIVSTTTGGFQYQQELAEGTYAFGANLAAGTEGLGGAATRFSVDETYEDSKIAGGLLTQQFGWRDRLFVSGGVRADNSSAFGENFGTIFYPSGQASWVVSEEEFFPLSDALSQLRLRAAYGQSGLRPENRAALTYFNQVPVRVNAEETPGITLGGVGDADLRPERTSEFELGFDLGALGNRVNLEFTYYNKTSDDALVARRTAPSAGVTSTIFQNIGSIRNSGVEAVLGIDAIAGDNFGWRVSTNFSTNENEVVRLGDGIPPIIFGLGSSQRHVQDYPLGGYWGERITAYADTDDDGIVDDVTFSDTAEFLGSSIPKYQVGVENTFTFFERVRISALVDYRGGFKQYNASEDFRCAIGRCQGINDPTVSQDIQARSIASLFGVYSGWIEDASFVRLREVSLTIGAPERFASRLGATGLSLTLSGRNLGLWSDYSGLDPEVNAQGQENFSQSDFLSQPLVRQFQARVNLTF